MPIWLLVSDDSVAATTIEERFDFRQRTAALEALYQSILDVSRPQRGSLANAIDR